MDKTILIASDHAGFELKEKLERALGELGYDVQDLGTDSADSTDYADYPHPLADKVPRGDVQRGVLTCGTGLGMSYTANRFPRVRAALAWNEQVAELSRQHGNSNLLVLPAQFVSEEQGVNILHKWLETNFEGGRHARRVAKIDETGNQSSVISQNRQKTEDR